MKTKINKISPSFLIISFIVVLYITFSFAVPQADAYVSNVYRPTFGSALAGVQATAINMQVWFDRGTYTPGQNMNISAEVCGDDAARSSSARVGYNLVGGGGQVYVIDVSNPFFPGCVSNSVTRSAPSIPGTYTYFLNVNIPGYSGGPNPSATIVVAEPRVDGQCGASLDGNNFLTNPNQSLACNSGTLSNWQGNLDGWTWNCNGSGAGHTDDSCSAGRTYNGSCGTSLDSCSTGFPYNTVVNGGSAGDTTSLHRWGCQGLNGGSNTSPTTCTLSKNANENGSCGNAINNSYSSAPNTQLCSSSGGNSSVSFSGGRWRWSCYGQGTGGSELCSATQSSFSCQGSIPSNASQYSSETNPSSNINWAHSSSNTGRQCEFACNGGHSWNGSSCAPDPGAPACGSADGRTYNSAPSTNLCAPGTTLLGGGLSTYVDRWEWSCFVPGAGLPAARCSATNGTPPPPPPPPILCGAAAGVPTSRWPRNSMCTSGQANPAWRGIAAADREGVAPVGTCTRWWTTPRETYSCYLPFVYDEPAQQGDYDWSCGFYHPSGWGWQHRARCSAPYLDPDPIPDPPSVSASCDLAGNIEVNYSSPGASSYDFRLDSNPASFTRTCSSVNPGDVCQNGIGAGPYTSSAGVAGRSYNVWVHACNGSGQCSPTAGSDSFSCPVVNLPPVVEAGIDGTATLPAGNFTVSTASASDPEGAPLTLSWIFVDGPMTPSIISPNTLSPTFSNMNSAGVYTFRLTANDGQTSTSDEVPVTVSSQPIHVLSVTTSGQAASIGTVDSAPPGISCPGDCSEAYTQGDGVTLTGTVTNGFTQFTGDCVGTNSCFVTVNAPTSVNAEFRCNPGFSWTGTGCLERYNITIAPQGEAVAAVGRVITLNPGSVDCSSGCTETLDRGTNVTITGSLPNGTVEFNGGDCTSSVGSCSTTLTGVQFITADLTCDSSYQWSPATNSCELEIRDLVVPALSVAPTAVNPITGIYSNVAVSMLFTNIGNTNIPAGLNIPYKASIGSDTSPLSFYNNAVSAGASTGIVTINFTDVPYGNYDVIGSINVESTDVVGESDRSNNENNDFTGLSNFVLLAPKPPMGIDVSRDLVTRGGGIDVTWFMEVDFPVTCRVEGKDISENFNPFDGVADGVSAEVRVSRPVVINNQSTFTLTCTETSTGEVFTESTTVEVIPTIQEI